MKRSANAGPWLGVVVHHTAGNIARSLQDIRDMHIANGYEDIGYHYFMEVDSNGRGHLKRGRSTELQGCHGVKWYNDRYLGFCIEGNYDEDRISEQLYQDILGAVKHILKANGIPRDRVKVVLGHRDVHATACPGKFFTLTRLKNEVAG
jgi:hypothetical protein